MIVPTNGGHFVRCAGDLKRVLVANRFSVGLADGKRDEIQPNLTNGLCWTVQQIAYSATQDHGQRTGRGRPNRIGGLPVSVVDGYLTSALVQSI